MTQYGRHFLNTSLELGRASKLRELEFFPWVLGFSLEFWVFSLSFRKFLPWELLFSWSGKFFSEKHEKSSLFRKYLLIKMTYLGVPLEIWPKDEVFFLNFSNLSNVTPRGWVFSMRLIFSKACVNQGHFISNSFIPMVLDIWRCDGDIGSPTHWTRWVWSL